MKICRICKSENVESFYWVNPNIKEIGEQWPQDNNPEEVNYCKDYMEFVTLGKKE